jgi:signal transduction histidine kinase
MQAGDRLTLTVMDTGLGFTPHDEQLPPADKPVGSGFGLTQLRERLITLYAGAADIAITANTPSGTIVTITLPMPQDESDHNLCTVRTHIQRHHERHHAKRRHR